MSSLSTPTPPRIDELPAAVANLLDVSAMQTLLGGANRVVTPSEDIPLLKHDTIGRVVVLLRQRALGSAHLDRVRFVELVVRADCYLPQAGFDVDRYLGRVHAEIFSLLEGVSPSLSYAAVAHPLRLAEPPSPALEADERKFFYSRSIYRIALKPV